MSKKNNIEELFKDSMDDFRVDPPKETSRKILLGLFWSNVLYKYKGSITAGVAAVVAGVGLLVFNQMGDEQSDKSKELATNEVVNKTEVVQINDTSEVKTTHSSTSNSTNEVPQKSSNRAANEQQNTVKSANLNTSKLEDVQVSNSNANNIAASSGANKGDKTAALATTRYKTGKVSKSNKTKIKSANTDKGSITLNTSNSINDQGFIDAPKDDNHLVAQENSIENKAGDEKVKDDQSLQEAYLKNYQEGKGATLDSATETANKENTDTLAQSTNNGDSLGIDSTKKPLDPLKKKLPVTFFVGAGFSAQQTLLPSESNYKFSPLYLAELNAGVKYKSMYFLSGIGYENQVLTLENRNHTQIDSVTVKVPYKYFDTITMKDTTVYVEQNQAVEKNSKLPDGRSVDMKYLYVPIQFAYERSFIKHLIMVKGGVGMRFLYAYSQTNEATDTTGLTEIVAPLFEPKRFQLNYNLQLNYGYHISPKLLVMAGVSFRQNLSDEMVVSLSNIDPPYHTISLGGSLQILYKF